MKLDLTEKLVDIRDNEFIFIEKFKKGTKEIELVPLTLLEVFAQSLTNIEKTEFLEVEKKYKLASLLELIYRNPENTELPIEDLSLIKARAAKFYNPLVLVAINKIIEK